MLVLLGLLYSLPGYLIPLYLCAAAFFNNEKDSRYYFLGAVGILFFLPLIFAYPIPQLVMFILRTLAGIFCYLYLTYHKIPLRIR
jgi:hypothetical protein